MKKILAALMMMGVMLVGMTAPVWANAAMCNQSGITAEEQKLLGCNSTTTAPKEANALIKVVIPVGGLVAVVVMIIGGILMGISNGNADKFKRGRDCLLYGAIGLVVVILAYAIVNFVVEKV